MTIAHKSKKSLKFNLHVNDQIMKIYFLCTRYPNKKDQIFNDYVPYPSLPNFVKNGRNMSQLAKYFPDHQVQLFNLAEKNFEQLVSKWSDFVTLLQGFHKLEKSKDKLNLLLANHTQSEEIIGSHFFLLQRQYPLYEINDLKSFKLAIKKVYLSYPEQKYYTKGACMGFFKNLLPPEVSKHISKFLDEESGLNIGLSCKAAHDIAIAEKERFLSFQ